VYSKEFLLSLGLDPAVFDPDFVSTSFSKDKLARDHHNEEVDPLLTCGFELVAQV
jgi:hypothetical protein